MTDAELDVLIDVSLKEVQRLCEQLAALVDVSPQDTLTFDSYAWKIARLVSSVSAYKALKTKGA